MPRGVRWTALAGLATGIVVLLSGGTLHAAPTDLFGLDPRNIGAAGATEGFTRGWSAACGNPALTAETKHVSVGMAYSFGRPDLQIDGADAKVMDIRGVSFGMTLPFQLPQGLRLGFGVTGYVPDQFLARVQLVPPYEPRFLFLDNPPDRLVMTAVAGLKVWRLLSLGIGATILADASGEGVRYQVDTKGGSKQGNASMDLTLPMRVAPVAGLFFGPIHGFMAAVTYRGQLDLRFALDVVADVDVAGVVTGDTIISMHAVNHFTPHRLLGAAAYRWRGLLVAASVAWLAWSRFNKAIPDLAMHMDLGLVPPLIESNHPQGAFHDTLALRVGGRYRFQINQGRRRLDLRLGYGWVPTPVSAQTGLSALLDNDRHVFAFGLGLDLGRIAPSVPWWLRLDLAFQYHFLVERRDERTLRWGGLMGGIRYGGNLYHLSLGCSVRF